MGKASQKTLFECTACGAQSPKWLGKCPGCSAWSTLQEVREKSSAKRAARAAAVEPVPLAEVVADDVERRPTGIAALDRVLGGGVVPGGVVLLGGDPGIGKSTLLMQALSALSRGGAACLYVTGEESAAQVALRARRLGAEGEVLLLPTTDLSDVLSALSQRDYDVVVLDSIQTVRAPDLESAAGTVSQLREVAGELTERAKRSGAAMFLIGHVTKEGALAGPKVLEHLVDTVISFEGDPTHAYRLVRASKNRFGPAHEVGVFEMVQDGLREVADPSAMFIGERAEQASGTIVVPTAQGSRPLLVEIQALVASAQYGAPRRVVTGLDVNRLAVLSAVLQRKVGVQVLDQDVFASAAGGARVDEPAVDLALCGAIVSSLRERPIAPALCAFGEVGLSGELRAVPKPAARIAEARKLGFTRIVLPRGNAERLTAAERRDVELLPAASLAQALDQLFER